MNYPHTTKDSKGNLIHFKDSNGFESWWDYDNNNNRIHFKDSNGYEAWWDYDSKGNMIHCKSSTYEYWYDSNGNRIPDPNAIKEVTLEDIAKQFNIPVKNLRIKD